MADNNITVWAHSFNSKGWPTSAHGIAEDILAGFDYQIFDEVFITFSIKTETTEEDDDPSWYKMLEEYAEEYLKGIHFNMHGYSCREIGKDISTIYYFNVKISKNVPLPSDLKKSDIVQVELNATAESDY